jgi:hypothetical protein
VRTDRDGFDVFEELSLEIGVCGLPTWIDPSFGLSTLAIHRVGTKNDCAHHHSLNIVITIDVDLLVDLLAGNVEKVLRDPQEGMNRVVVDVGDDDGEDLGGEWSCERSL